MLPPAFAVSIPNGFSIKLPFQLISTANVFAAGASITNTGWPTANGGAWSSQQGGSAAYTLPNSNSTFGENDTSLRDRSANGLAFWMDVYLPADAAGNWDVALEAQASDFSVIRTGGFVRLTKGATTRLVVEVTPAQAGSMRRIQLNVAANAGTQWH